ncbi:MAG: 50S ribosomal protein L11 methyltransferase [Thermodesulfovibrionales bacterium]|nr:50S ribosomal protein L11 methyltransferase [Thermodesulfovibrionales bacterium]
MQWFEIQTLLPLSLLESTYNFLWSFVHGITVEKSEKDFQVRAYLYAPDSGNIMKRLNNFLHIQAKSFPTKYMPPIAQQMDEISSDTFIIVPSPSAHIPPSGTPIFIQRGRSFGIGSHPCTIYCLEGLKTILKNDPLRDRIHTVLDAGTGTGVLAIAAAKMGVSNITGVEIVSDAVMEAVENVRCNKVEDKISIIQGSVTEISGRYDLILANLYGVFLKEIVTSLVQRLSPHGFIVLGGMTLAQIEPVFSVYTPYGLKEFRRYADEEWGAAVLQR